MRFARLLVLPLCCALTVHAATPAAPTVVVPLDPATLSVLPHEAISASAHGKALHCEGVALPALLRKVGAMPAEPLRGTQLARIVSVTARDGYRVAFSLAEVDPGLGKTRVFVVDRCDGKPLDDKDGPVRLVVPDESRPARWVRQVQAMTVQDMP